MIDQSDNRVPTEPNIKRHSNKPHLTTPTDCKDAMNVLQAVDREVDFYRKRAGQVLFFGSLVEVLLLAGEKKIVVPEHPLWVQPIVYSVSFIAVACIGILLGSEYRSRIRILKDARMDILEALEYKSVYPDEDQQRLSEIQVLYFVLGLVSSSGLALSWLKWRDDLSKLVAEGKLENFPNWLARMGIFCGLIGLISFIGLVIWWRFKSRAKTTATGAVAANEASH